MFQNRTLQVLLLPLVVASLAVCAPASDDGSAPSPEGTPGGAYEKKGDDGKSPGTDIPRPEDESRPSPAGPIGEACATEPFDVPRLKSDLSYLASTDLAGRAPGSAGDKAARKFIEDRFKCLGLSPGGIGGSFVQELTDSDAKKTGNIIGVLPGSDSILKDDVIVVSAHMDHFGRTDQEECKGLCLGANDNGSGTTTVLAIAQALRQKKAAPKRTIAFILFASEELGCEGSHYFVKHPTTAVPLTNVVYTVNFDMVGSYTQWNKKVVAHGTVANTPGLAVMKPLVAPSGLNVEINVPGIEEDDSDYYPFCAAGVPMVSFFTHDPKCYHKSCDTVDKIDFPNMSKIGKLGSDLVAGLSDASADLAAFRKAAKVSALGCTGYPNPADAD